MSKRKKKNAIMLVSLLIALVALIGFYVWYLGKDQIKEKEGKDNTTASEAGDKDTLILATLDMSVLKSVHLINENADMKFILEGEEWKLEADPDRPINQVYVKKILDMIDEIKAKRVINENPEDLDEYGLADSAVYLQAVQNDGKTMTLKVGDKSIGGEGYYALVDDKNTVYLLDTAFGTGLNYSDTDMTAVEGGPDITAENIYHIEVQKKTGENFELRYDTDNKNDKSRKGLFPWIILQPYEESYSADSSKVSELLPKFSDFNLNTCVDYHGEDLAKYGLEDPTASIFVEYYETYTEPLKEPKTDPATGKEITEKIYREDKNFKLYVGNEDGNGNYYVRKEGSNAVYTMNAEKVNSMLTVDAFGIMSSFISIPNIEQVNQIDIEIEGKPYTMEIKRKTVKEVGQDKLQATYYYNGNVVEEDVFKGVYQAMIGAGYDTKISEDIVTEGNKPFMTITYHLEGEQILTTSYIPYNESFYLIDNGNPIRFFADKRKIDEIAKTVIDFVKPELY